MSVACHNCGSEDVWDEDDTVYCTPCVTRPGSLTGLRPCARVRSAEPRCGRVAMRARSVSPRTPRAPEVRDCKIHALLTLVFSPRQGRPHGSVSMTSGMMILLVG